MVTHNDSVHTWRGTKLQVSVYVPWPCSRHPCPPFLASSEVAGLLPLSAGLGPSLFVWVASLLPSCQSPSTEERFLPWGNCLANQGTVSSSRDSEHPQGNRPGHRSAASTRGRPEAELLSAWVGPGAAAGLTSDGLVLAQGEPGSAAPPLLLQAKDAPVPLPGPQLCPPGGCRAISPLSAPTNHGFLVIPREGWAGWDARLPCTESLSLATKFCGPGV